MVQLCKKPIKYILVFKQKRYLDFILKLLMIFKPEYNQADCSKNFDPSGSMNGFLFMVLFLKV